MILAYQSNQYLLMNQDHQQSKAVFDQIAPFLSQEQQHQVKCLLDTVQPFDLEIFKNTINKICDIDQAKKILSVLEQNEGLHSSSAENKAIFISTFQKEEEEYYSLSSEQEPVKESVQHLEKEGEVNQEIVQIIEISQSIKQSGAKEEGSLVQNTIEKMMSSELKSNQIILIVSKQSQTVQSQLANLVDTIINQSLALSHSKKFGQMQQILHQIINNAVSTSTTELFNIMTTTVTYIIDCSLRVHTQIYPYVPPKKKDVYTLQMDQYNSQRNIFFTSNDLLEFAKWELLLVIVAKKEIKDITVYGKDKNFKFSSKCEKFKEYYIHFYNLQILNSYLSKYEVKFKQSKRWDEDDVYQFKIKDFIRLYRGKSIAIYDLVEEDQQVQLTLNFTLLLSIKYLVKFEILTQLASINEVYKWLKILADAYNKQLSINQQKQLFSDRYMFMGYEVSTPYLYFLYGVYKEEVYSIMQKYSLIKRMELKSFALRKWDKSIHYETMQLFYLQYLIYNKMVDMNHHGKWQLMDHILKTNITLQPSNVVRRLMMRCSVECPNALARSRQLVSQHMMKSQLFTVQDYLLIQSRYLFLCFRQSPSNSNVHPYYRARQLQQQDNLILLFIKELIDKSNASKHKQDQREIQVNKQGLNSIFLRFNKGWVNSDYSLRISESKFCNMYSLLKRLLKCNGGVGQAIFKSLFVKLRSHYPVVLQKHSIKLLILMLVNPVLAQQEQQLSDYMQKHNFTNYEVSQLIEQYLSYADMISLPKFLDSLPHISSSRDFQFYSIFKKINDILQIHNYPHAESVKKIFMALLSSLKISINQKDISKHIKNSFGLNDNQLRIQYIKKICQQIRRQVRYDQHFYNIINKSITYQEYEKKEFFISIYFENQHSALQEVEEKLWICLVKNIEYLSSIKTRFRVSFQPSSKRIIKKIQENRINSEQLNALKANVNQMKPYLSKDFIITVENSFNKKQKFYEQLKLIQYILQKCQNLSEVASYFIRKQSDMKTKDLSQIYIAEIGEDQKWLFQYCEEIRILTSYQFSTIINSKNSDQLKIQFQKQKNQLLMICQKFKQSNLTIQELHKYFAVNLAKDCCSVFCKDLAIREGIIKSANKAHMKNIMKLQQYVLSYLNLLKCLRSNLDTSQFNLFIQIVARIQAEPAQVQVTEVVRLIESVQKEISEVYKIKIDNNNPLSLIQQLQNNQITHVINSTYRSMPLFEMIQSRNIDQRSIADLKEYINDQQNSSLRLDSIKQFENILEYWTLLKKSTSIKQFIKSLQKKVQKSQGQIWKHIDNCYSIYRLIDQKLDQAANRQTSFKYEIQAIFESSILSIKKLKDSIQIQVVTSPLLTNISMINRELTIQYRRLQMFKDKSILLISDIERQQNQDQNIQKTLLIFKRFQEYFRIVEKIHNLVRQLLSYGYNTKFIQADIKVTKNDFSQLNAIEHKLEKMCSQWVKGIRELYKQSYLLTHFIGSQLSVFINRCISNQYHPSLYSILKLTQADFKETISNEEFSNCIKIAAKAEPLEQITSIVKLYLRFQENIRKNKLFKTGRIVMENVAEKYYYCCLFEQNKVSQANRVFYCLQQTKTQQIEVFLWRALIDPSRVYYFVGVHNLKQEIKLTFWNQILYLLQHHKQSLEAAQFTFIDNLISDKFYSFLFKSKLFNIIKNQPFESDLEDRTKKMINLLPSTWIVQSAKAGLGKTFTINSLAQIQDKTVRYFPISGNISFNKLASRLKKLSLKSSECLSISLFQVQDWRKIEVFLSQIILFRCFYYQEFVYLPQDLWIYVEIQNIYQQKEEDMYPLIGLLTKYNQGVFIKQFQIHLICFDTISDQQKFVLLYLNILDTPGKIAKQELYFHQLPGYSIPQNAHVLIEKYFYSWFTSRKQHATFTGYKCFMKMLYKTFKAFSECEYLKAQNVDAADAQFEFLQFNKFRQAFLHICIQNVLQFLQQTYTSNDFSSNQDYETFHQRMNSINMLILPSTKMGHYQFVYTSQEKVPFCIKSILLTQNYQYFNKIKAMKAKEQIHKLFEPTALNNLDQHFLEQRLKQMLMSIADEVMDANIPPQLRAYYYPNFDQYKLTLDNFIKICLIWHRASSGIPCILMGESGVGKTKLISFFVQQVMKNVLIVINLHAGIHQEQLIRQVENIKRQAYGWGAQNRIWVFFDEFNTCDELGYIKQMVIDHRFMGEPLPQNIVIVAACNPYRKKRKGKLIHAGIKRPNDEQNQLAFTVKAPPISMVQLIWDYQQLKSKEIRIYIEKMLQKINYAKKRQLIDSIVYTHQFLKDNVEISSASLRDVARFKKIYEWFDKFMPRHGERNSRRTNPNYRLDRSQRCIILTYSFCYCLRLAANEQREHLYGKMEQNLQFAGGHMKRVVFNEQVDYVSRLTISDEQIALNTALIQNVFTCLVCLLNKIPILLIGNPGSSKSLSMRLIQSNMRGKGSQSQFCRQFPELNVLYFQGSQSSTSRGVQQIFQKAMRWKSQANKKWQIQQCILFDQIGLAQKSIHNPLKVLHAKLQTSSEQICFIGISNWQLDLAKMSRFLVLARSNPDEKDLAQTAYQIANSFIGASQESEFINYQVSQRKWESLGQHYYQFIQEWQKKQQNKKHFFGLRDFYGYVKFVCGQVIKQKGKLGSFDRAVDKSIQINFDGQHGSVQLFKRIARSPLQKQLNPLQLIQFNLQRPQSRCLLLIVKGDSLVPLINKGINLDNQRKMICIHGSTFSIDQQSEEYNQQMTALTINHISRGNVLAFKDINNSIQTSLYDLFNKSFTKVGNKRYCRIAVGANSNPKCLVHHNFNAIVYTDEARLEILDPPFLNRFEKHYLNIKNMINSEEMELVEEVKRWVEEILAFRSKESILKTEQFLVNSGEESIITLVIKHKKSQNALQKIKKDLLLNQTTDFFIAMENNQQFPKQLPKHQKTGFVREKDYLIFTYDEFLNLTEDSIFESGYTILIQQVKSEKQLRSQLKKSISQQQKNIQIYLNYQNHRQHLSFILFLIDQLKTSLDIDIQFFVIIQMHRFSLHHLKIEHVNISYLHPFEQVFMQTLNRQRRKQLEIILQAKSYYQTYQILEMQKSFSTHFTEMIKCCKFVTLHEKNTTLTRIYYQECLLLREEEYFVEICLKSIKQSLKHQRIDFKLLQYNNQAIISCSNFLEAVERHIQDKVRQIIFIHLKLVIQRGFLLHFTSNMPKYQKQYLSQSFLLDYLINKDFIYSLVKEQFNDQQIQQRRQKIPYEFKRGILQNIIAISEELYLLPASKNQFSHLFTDNSLAFKNRVNVDSFSQQEIRQIIANQIESLRAESKICKIYNTSNDNRPFIQKCAVFDILTLVLSSKKRKKYNVERISTYLLSMLTQYSIEQRIIVLGLDFTLTILLLDLLQSISENQEVAKTALLSISFNKNTQGIKQLIKNIAQKILECLSPSTKIVSLFKTVQIYCEYFRNIYNNIKTINVSFSIFEEAYIEKIQVLQEFLIFLSHHKQNMANSMIEQYERNKDLCISQNIFNILHSRIHNTKDSSVKQQNIAFLTNYILSLWMKDKKQSKAQNYSNAIVTYLQLVNQYPVVANKSSVIFQTVFQLGNQFQSLSKCLQQIKNRTIQQIEDLVDFKNNNSVAIGFYFSKIIENSLTRQFEINLENQQKSALIIRQHFERFKENVDTFFDQDTTKISKIALLQFCKIYCSNYLKQLTNHQNKYHLLDQIDNFLCKEGEIKRHLRLYMTKCLVMKYGTLQKVRRYFIEMKRCFWILHMKQLLQEERTEIILPITPKDQEYTALINSFTKSNFSNIEIFHEVVRLGLQTCERTYLMLTYFFTTFYMRNSPEQYIHFLIEQIQGREDLKSQEQILIKKVLIFYLHHRICQGVQCNLKRQNNAIQVILINYINIMISCRKMNSPLCEMFFNQQGQSPSQYQNWIKERYLIASMDNPAAERIKYLLQKYKGDAAFGQYILCTQKSCCYSTPVGGFFNNGDENMGCGSLDPGTIFKCNLCGKINKILQNNSYEGRIVDEKGLQAERDIIEGVDSFSYRKDEQNYLINLKGYQLGVSLKQIKQNFSLKEHFFRVITDFMEPQPHFVSFKILQSISYFMWLILSETQSIQSQQFQSIFSMKSKELSQFLIESSQQLLKSANSSIGFKDKEDVTIWHFAFAQQLFGKLSKKLQQPFSITSYKIKKDFECLVQQLTRQYCGSKQKTIVQNRKSLIINKSEVLKQFGNVELHQQQYSLVKMFKGLQQQSESTKAQILIKDKMDTLCKQYPLLAYLLNFKQAQNLKHYFNILLFISKVSTLNLKMSRSDSNQSIMKTVQHYLAGEDVVGIMKSCIYSWNQLVKNKYRLKDGCHYIGYLQKIDEKMPIKYFILDKNNMQNIQSRKLAAFITTITAKYNEICQIMQNLALENNHKFMSQFKMNPCTFNGQYYLQIPSLQHWLTLYSYHSVEYGLKQLEYQLQKINNLAIKKLSGCRYFIESQQQFQYIQFIGQDNSFMIFIREDQQLPLEPHTEQKILQYFKKQQKKRGETFYKFIKELIGCLENLIVCFKNKRNLKSTSIGDFVNEFKNAMRVNFNKQLNEDPIQSLPIFNLGALYQLLQAIAFNYNIELINPIYRQKLDESQIRILEPYLQRMKNKVDFSTPTLPMFKCVFQRFISRILLLGNVPSNHPVTNYICEIYWLWPKNEALDNYKDLKSLLCGIQTKKSYSIMKLIERMQKISLLPQQAPEEIIVKKAEKQIKPLKKMAANKAKKQRKGLD